MPGQIFDEAGQAASWSDGVTAIVNPVDIAPDTPPPPANPPSDHGLLGFGTAGVMWPGSMAWSAGVIKVQLVKVRTFNYTHTWYKDNVSQEDIFANHVISMQVRILRQMLSMRNFEYTRQWNGLGGVIYIPSFPQLERKETAWPHAT